MPQECKLVDDLPQGCCVRTNEDGKILFSRILQYIHGFEESDISNDRDTVKWRQESSSIS